MIEIFKVNSNNKLIKQGHTYASAHRRDVRISNNVVKLNIVSSMQAADIQTSSLTDVTIGQNVQSLDTSCFANCENLKTARTYSNLKDIGDQAFYNCRSLTSITMLNQLNPSIFENIGVSAFANTGLIDIGIQLSSTDIATQIGGYAFAGCPQLRSVKQIGSSYTSDYEFANCTALTSFEFANHVSFVAEHVFENCTGLKTIHIQNNCKGLNNYVFNGCTNLTQITFGEPGHMNYWHAIDDYAFKDTAIESITFPSCITSFSQLGDYALFGMPKLKQLKFNGIASKDMFTQMNFSQEFEYKPGKMYSGMVANTPTGGTTKSKVTGVFQNRQSEYNYTDYYEEMETAEVNQIITICQQSKIPLVVIHTYASATNCTPCSSFFKNVINTPEFLSWVKSDDNKYIICIDAIMHSSNNVYSKLKKAVKAIHDFTKDVPSDASNMIPIVLMYWQDTNDVIHAFGRTWASSPNGVESSNINTPAKFIEKIKSVFSDYSGTSNTTASIVFNSNIFDSNCFGLNHDVEIYGSDGGHVTYKDNGLGSTPSIEYTSEVQIDRMTVDDFRYGQWYMNAKDLREYADTYQIPVFVEYSSKNCPPCEEYGQYIFRDPDFQEYVKNKKILFCSVVASDNFSSGQEHYITNTWANSFPDRDRTGRMPVMMMYWNTLLDEEIETETGEIIHQYISNAQHEFKYYDGREYVGQPNENPNNMCYTSAITAWIDDFVSDYRPETRFQKPTVSKIFSNTTRYFKYNNQTNDNYGRYIPAKRYASVGSGTTFNIKVRNSSNVLTQYSIRHGMASSSCPPAGTYMYYTTISVDNSYEATYDLSGIVFKIGKAPETDPVISTPNQSLTEYLTAISVPTSVTPTIQRLEDVYLMETYIDEDGDEVEGYTTNLDPEYDFDTDPPHNTIRTYIVDGTNSSNLYSVKLYTMAVVSISEQDHDLVFGLDETVVKSEITNLQTTNSLIWLSAFYNYDIN